MSHWWEREALRFACQPGCINCCNKPGVVVMRDDDIARAAGYLDCAEIEFKKRYLTRDENYLWHIDVAADKPCPFLRPHGCAIHEAKPVQCRTYPFWRENLQSRNHWLLAGGFCPGIGHGPVAPPQAVKRALRDHE